uniref:Rad60/SUMO-like domain-containing protein n=1 Tax=Ailuropoda melanoleuca TaxID=9646 RepID=A0A7N5P591_AILME
MAEEKPKEEVLTENNNHIHLKVAGQDGSMVYFKIKRHTLLSKLMKAYCERQVCEICIRNDPGSHPMPPLLNKPVHYGGIYHRED